MPMYKAHFGILIFEVIARIFESFENYFHRKFLAIRYSASPLRVRVDYIPYSVYYACMKQFICVEQNMHALTCENLNSQSLSTISHSFAIFLEQMASLNKALCMAMLISNLINTT